MGHAAFYAVGAYTTAILNTRLDVPILWALPAAGLLAALFALLVARPVIHLRGDYLLVVTIGLGEIVRIALVNDVFGLTGGGNGIFGIARPDALRDQDPQAGAVPLADLGLRGPHRLPLPPAGAVALRPGPHHAARGPGGGRGERRGHRPATGSSPSAWAPPGPA